MRITITAICLLLLCSGTISARSDKSASAASAAREALSADNARAGAAAAQLRAMGPAGLNLFLDTNRDDIEHAATTGELRSRVFNALDSICRQKDCYASRLYWYTDINEAKAAAAASGKPILSLRLLGKLDEDLSCANSRFFRLTLYANEQVSKLLRDRFILHWESVRPVPKVTIDFGDGRKLERTLTGNSIHYILDEQGRPLDALPGLYGPAAFLRGLARAEEAFHAWRNAEPAERERVLRSYHLARLASLQREWNSDIKAANLQTPPPRESAAATSANPPSAPVAATGAITKALVTERPILRGIYDRPELLNGVGFDDEWGRIAALHWADAQLDSATRRLMRLKDARLTADRLERMAGLLEEAIAKDSVRNEYVLHARLHGWFASGRTWADVSSLNERVYAELFATPSSDRWLGLRDDSTYSGLDNDGVKK